MRWLAKYTQTDYAPNATRAQRKFAWWPVYIKGYMIWLETYEILQIYIVEEIKIEEAFFSQGNWKNVTKRTIN